MSALKVFIRDLLGHNKDVRPHANGMKNLLDIFPDKHPGRECIETLICDLLTGKLELVKIPATDRFDVPPTGTRQIWENQLGNQKVEPLQYFYPETLKAGGNETPLIEILQYAMEQGLRVKAAGSGHSYSDVATTPDLFINTHGLCKVSAPDTIVSRNMKPGSGRVTIAGPIEGALKNEWLKGDGLSLSTGPVNWTDYAPETNRTLVEMQGGIRLHYLNEVLDKWNLGLANMGGYDGQTMVGATMTSTHGTGITLPPFPDSVRSMVLVTTGQWTGSPIIAGGANQGKTGEVYLYRIEPSDGITDPTKYDDPEIGLIQDDDAFYSATCNMGTFGVIYSFTVEVMQKYYLEETRELTTLDKVMKLLKPDPSHPEHIPSLLADNRHVEILVHPYPMDENENVMLMDPDKDPEYYWPYFHVVLERWHIANPPGDPTNPIPGGNSKCKDHRNYMSGFLGKFRISFEATATIFKYCPEITPRLALKSLKTLEDCNYINVSHKIFVNGMSQYAGFANEIAYPIEDKNQNYTDTWFRNAINKIHQIGQSSRLNGNQYQTSPFSVRFVKKSNALMSMQHGTNTCMIELDLASGTWAGEEILFRYQDSQYEMGGIPHWGLEFDQLTGSNGLINSLYPKTYDRFLKVYQQFNSQGTFNNSFTDRVGFSKIEFSREEE